MFVAVNSFRVLGEFILGNPAIILLEVLIVGKSPGYFVWNLFWQDTALPGRKIEKETQGGRLSPGKGPPSPGGPQTHPIQALEGNSSARVSPSTALGLAPAAVGFPRGMPGGHADG